MTTAGYDLIGHGYGGVRRPDHRLAAAIWAALGDAASVVNVGAGTGSYEPPDRDVIAIEPSDVMIAQRPSKAAPAIKASAEALPLADKSVDAALAVLTLQHWDDVERGLGEMNLTASDDVLRKIASYTSGDARSAYNVLEVAAGLAKPPLLARDARNGTPAVFFIANKKAGWGHQPACKS